MQDQQRDVDSILRQIALLSCLVLAACDRPEQENPTSPALQVIREGQHSQNQFLLPIPQFPELEQFISTVEIGLPKEPTPWEESGAALVEWVRRAEGEVAIGFKPTDAPRTRQTGVVPAMLRAEVMAARRAVEGLGARIVRTYRISSTIVALIDPDLAPAIEALPMVNWVEPLFPGHITTPLRSGTLLPVQAPPQIQDTSWGHLKVNAPRAWQNNHTGSDAFVTILDTGVDSTHMWDLYGDANDTGFWCAYAEPHFQSCWDDNGHGSLVHSVALSINSPYGYIGIAHSPRGNAMVKVCDSFGRCDPADVAGGFDWSATNGQARQIVSVSIGFEFDFTAVREAVVRSANAGNLLVAAAGNGGTPAQEGVRYPARYDQVIAVSGTLENDGFASGAEPTPVWCIDGETQTPGTSRYGWEVELSAPFWADGMALDRGYQHSCGTSFATPLVAGAGALIWSAYPASTAATIRSWLQSAVVDLGPSGRDFLFGYGRLDVCRLLTCAPPPGPLTVSIQGPTLIQSAGDYSWEAMPSNGTGTYAYQWSVFYVSSGMTQTLGTAKTQWLSVDAFCDFEMRVEVISGSETASNNLYVTNQVGGACGPERPVGTAKEPPNDAGF